MTRSDAIETAKTAFRTAITGMAAHWRMAFTSAKATKGERGIEGVSLNVLRYPKLPALPNGDPSFSLDWVYVHHDGLYAGLTIRTGPFGGLSADVNFDQGQVGRPRGTIRDRWETPIPSSFLGRLNHHVMNAVPASRALAARLTAVLLGPRSIFTTSG